MKKENRGFTLVELLVVMALIAVLAVLILGAIQLARNTATETVHRSNAKVIQASLEANFAKYKEYCAASASAGELTCSGAANGVTTDGALATLDQQYSFLGASARLGSSLSSGYSTTTTASGGKCGALTTDIDRGGGRITNLTSTGYAIIPANYGCTGYTSFSDVMQTGLSTPLSALPTF